LSFIKMSAVPVPAAPSYSMNDAIRVASRIRETCPACDNEEANYACLSEMNKINTELGAILSAIGLNLYVNRLSTLSKSYLLAHSAHYDAVAKYARKQ
jgi:hypothetical protein